MFTELQTTVNIATTLTLLETTKVIDQQAELISRHTKLIARTAETMKRQQKMLGEHHTRIQDLEIELARIIGIFGKV